MTTTTTSRRVLIEELAQLFHHVAEEDRAELAVLVAEVDVAGRIRGRWAGLRAQAQRVLGRLVVPPPSPAARPSCRSARCRRSAARRPCEPSPGTRRPGSRGRRLQLGLDAPLLARVQEAVLGGVHRVVRRGQGDLVEAQRTELLRPVAGRAWRLRRVTPESRRSARNTPPMARPEQGGRRPRMPSAAVTAAGSSRAPLHAAVVAAKVVLIRDHRPREGQETHWPREGAHRLAVAGRPASAPAFPAPHRVRPHGLNTESTKATSNAAGETIAGKTRSDPRHSVSTSGAHPRAGTVVRRQVSVGVGQAAARRRTSAARAGRAAGPTCRAGTGPRRRPRPQASGERDEVRAVGA